MKVLSKVYEGKALLMTRLEYNMYRGWSVPSDENPDDLGYMVTHGDHESWIPEELFKDKYSSKAFDFGQALALLRSGEKVARKGWNGKGMFLFLVPGSTFKVNRPPLLGIYEEGTEINYHNHIDMRTADGTIVPWLASQSDMLAEDWLIV